MIKLGASPYVLTGKGNMCAQRMILRDARGSAGHVLKATGWRTNSPYILQELAVLCDKTHVHVSLQNGLARRAAIWPHTLCLSILRGFRKQLQQDGKMSENHIGAISEEAPGIEDYCEESEYFKEFVDDVNGAPLDARLVARARTEEITGLHKHNVYTKVSLDECYKNTGKAPIGTRWVDHNKGDNDNPDVRCRLVGREFKGNDKREDLFAATPPLEAKKTLIVLASSQYNRNSKRVQKLSFRHWKSLFPCKG